MFQSKENTIGRVLLPFLFILGTILAVYNIRLSERISTLSAVVQNQGEKIASLERICGARRNRENKDVFNSLESKIISNKRNELKVHRSALSSETSKVSRIGKSSENSTVDISFDRKESKDGQRSSEQKEPQLPTRDILNRFFFETEKHHTIVKRSPKQRKDKRCRKLCRGKRGRRGDRGPPGKAGPQGPPGSMGYVGSTGPIGPIGPKGDSGSRGFPGISGPSGAKGEKGDIGNKGNRGDDGKPGPKGDKGQDGNSKTTELIHLVGNRNQQSTIIDMSRVKSAEDARFTHWFIGEKHGQVSYSDGYIHIKVTGFYYVYCQIHYSGRITYNRHQVYRNNKDNLLLGFDTFNRGKSVFGSNASTKFVGGVFRLKENDKLNVRGAATQYTFMKDSSYFGVFLIHAVS